MKKVLSLLLVITLILSVPVCADTNLAKPRDYSNYDKAKSDEVLFQVTSELYIDGKLESRETIDIDGYYYTKKIGSRQLSEKELIERGYKNYAGDPIIAGEPTHEETFECINDEEQFNLKIINWLASDGAGSSEIRYWCMWKETWEVDQFGNKVRLVKSTLPELLYANNDYSCLPTFSMTRTSWNVATRTARADGYIENLILGGTKTYTHSINAHK